MNAILILIRTLFLAMIRANRAMIRANRAMEPNQRNMQFGNLGCNLIIMGAISASATLLALVQPPEIIFAYPTYIQVAFSVVLGFSIVSGLAGITIGMFLLAMNNPGQHRCLAMVMLWASSVAASFAIGILLVASFSPP